MKGFLKFLIDFGPLAVFFIFYKKTGNILDAIIPLIIATEIPISSSSAFRILDAPAIAEEPQIPFPTPSKIDNFLDNPNIFPIQ